jgi:hypothetical protein
MSKTRGLRFVESGDSLDRSRTCCYGQLTAWQAGGCAFQVQDVCSDWLGATKQEDGLSAKSTKPPQAVELRAGSGSVSKASQCDMLKRNSLSAVLMSVLAKVNRNLAVTTSPQVCGTLENLSRVIVTISDTVSSRSHRKS